MSKKRSITIASLLLAAVLLSTGLYWHFRGNENQQFENYTRNLFCQEVAGSTISLHYTLKDPSAYGIENTPVTFGSCTADTNANCASADRSRLSRKNRLTYDVLTDYLTSSREMAPYALYEEPLAPLTGTQAQLPVLLSEYQFYTQADVGTYLELLTKTPEYFHSILEFEQAKSEAGLFMADYSADGIIKECQAFIDMGDDNYLQDRKSTRLNSSH